MKAWIGVPPDEGAGFRLVDVPDPVAGPDDVLIRVHAAGINRVDRQPKRSHFMHSEAAPAAIPGLEAAGVVIARGAAVTDVAIGDRVTSMVQGGCAELVRVNAALVMRVPDAMPWTVAAAIPVSYLTAHDALVTQGGFADRGSVLIHAVTSGVGIAALQLARLRRAAAIAGSSASAAKLAQLEPLGLTLGLVNPAAGFADAVLAHTGARGADVVIDNIGGGLLNETLRATAIGGRVIDVGRFGGTEAMIDLNLLAVRRIALIGVTFRTRSIAEHRSVVERFVADHGAHLVDGRLAPLIDRVFAFDELPAAIERGVRREQLGKLVLELLTIRA